MCVCVCVSWFCLVVCSRTHCGPPATTTVSRSQAAGEDYPSADCVERETAPHVTDLLRGQPTAGRSDEGAAGRDDRPEPQGHPCLVSKQTLQGQKENYIYETDATATKQ